MPTDLAPPDDRRKTLVDTAMELADNGIPVFPVGPNKTPVWGKGKSPNGRDGFHMASTDPDEVERLFDHSAATGIGMPTGKVSGVTVIDVDCGRGKPHRLDAAAWLESAKGGLWGSTVVRTGSGGLHYYCRYREGLKTGANVWAKGVDCRNDGGYVVIPPFMGYRFERQTEAMDWPEVPEPPVSRTVQPVIDLKDGRTPERVLALRDLISSGTTWHDPARDIIAHLVGSGWSDAEILKLAVPWTWRGYPLEQTFDEMCVMLVGARQKWDREQGPKTTDEARLWAMAGLWNGMKPETRRAFFEMITEAESDGSK